MRAHRSQDGKRRAPHRTVERGKRALAPLFICFSVPGPVWCKLGQPGVVFVLRGVLTGPQTFLCSIFVGFSFPGLLATAILDSFSLFELPNTCKLKILSCQHALCQFLNIFYWRVYCVIFCCSAKWLSPTLTLDQPKNWECKKGKAFHLRTSSSEVLLLAPPKQMRRYSSDIFLYLC